MYADDSSVYTSGNTVEEIKENLNVDLENVSDWSKANKMAINTDKTKSMLITSDQKRRNLSSLNLNCKLDDYTLENVQCEKLLGSRWTNLCHGKTNVIECIDQFLPILLGSEG